jgi:hypothetical protein
MVENGTITVTCEFCSANYKFSPDEVRDPQPEPRQHAGDQA